MARASVTKEVSGSEVVAASAEPMTMPARITAMAMRAALLVGSAFGVGTLAFAVGMVAAGAVRSCSSHVPMVSFVIGRFAASSRPAIPSCRSVVFLSAAGSEGLLDELVRDSDGWLNERGDALSRLVGTATAAVEGAGERFRLRERFDREGELRVDAEAVVAKRFQTRGHYPGEAGVFVWVEDHAWP
jgi:hypothetical protein